VTQQDLDQGSLYPPLSSIRDVSADIAAAVAAEAHRKGFARAAEPDSWVAFMKAQMYTPQYATYVGG
jgi:malate dehydrogenase (oxaloacetate-decarboxylating)(NADP+)